MLVDAVSNKLLEHVKESYGDEVYDEVLKTNDELLELSGFVDDVGEIGEEE